jgi:tetratricopeptide (TPR) repeat protein
MRGNWMGRTAALAGILIVTACLAQAQTGQLGRIDFPTSGAPAAQQEFIRGALLLHSFEYEDAREAFQRAEKLDPNFALAYWGEAMTFNHPLWMDRDRDSARAALAKLAPTPGAREAKAPTEREKMYLRAVETLYAEGEKTDRDLAYAAAMRDLHERFPQDADAACFYALSLLGTTEGVRDFRTYMRAAAILEDVFAKYPDHPGAIHYSIHCYDDPTHAPLGVRAASVYARIAPAASHAQHMISHIYIALGDWNAVVTSNEKAVAVSEDRLRRRGEPLSGRSHHALQWLEYAYLQQGRFREARAKLDTMAEDARANGSRGNRNYYASMRAAYIVEMPDSRNAPPSLGGQANAMDLFATGWSTIQAGDLDAARKALAEMKSLPQGGPSSGSGYMSGMNMGGASRGATIDGILQNELEAAILLKESKAQEAQALLEKAAAAEEGMSFEFGPPEVPKPVRELLGEVLLQLNRPVDARKQFELALARAPRRAQALLGEARAAAQSGDNAAAQRIYADLRQIWQNADAGFPPLQEVNRSLAARNSQTKSQR